MNKIKNIHIEAHSVRTCASVIFATVLSGGVGETLLPSCGARNFQPLGAVQNFDRCAISHSLHLPQAALVLNARASALEFENIYNIKIKSTELNRCFLSED